MELKEAFKKAYSIENMETHGAAGRKYTEIGSEEICGRTFTYYRDEAGDYWYRSSCGKDLEKRKRGRKWERK